MRADTDDRPHCLHRVMVRGGNIKQPPTVQCNIWCRSLAKNEALHEKGFFPSAPRCKQDLLLLEDRGGRIEPSDTAPVGLQTQCGILLEIHTPAAVLQVVLVLLGT